MTTLGIGPEARRRLSARRTAEIVADELRRQIIEGELSDGDLLPRQEILVEQFNVSLVSLREALRSGSAEIRTGAEVAGLRAEGGLRALELAGPDDVVILAGKGHETYQVLGTETIPFDEREIVREWIEAKGIVA